MKHAVKITSENIGANIRRFRMEHGETQQQLGEFLGYIDQGYVPLNSGVIGGIASGCGTGIAKATKPNLSFQ